MSIRKINPPLGYGLVLMLSFQAMAATDPPDFKRLIRLDLDALLNVEILSAAKKTEKLTDSAAAVFVITQEDLRRSGATSIPEALRMAPGVQVGRINSYAYSISVRGFSSAFSNKLLVLVDGRSVYTPEFSGVYWDMVDYPLADIERIEVIRGPGGTLWGSNAVNGVINIITKHTADTHGTLADALAGSYEKYSLTLRDGGNLDETSRTHYRVYAKTLRCGDLPPQPEDLPIYDHWRSTRLGFRLDSQPDAENHVTMQGNFFDNLIGEDQPELWAARVDGRGADLLLRWTRRFSDDGEIQLQAYTDYMSRDDRSLLSFEDRSLDLDFQHLYRLNPQHELLWGLNYRKLSSDTIFTEFHEFRPKVLDAELATFFIQDDWQVVPEALELSLGTKLEQHYYTGLEFQPSVRLLWQPRPATTLWGAVSRAVRTPSRFEYSAFTERPAVGSEADLFAPHPVIVRRRGSSRLGAENLTAYELGLRQRFHAGLSVDGTVFLNQYHDLIIIEDTVLREGETYVLNEGFVNGMDAAAYGLEFAANWLPANWWRVQFAYSLLTLEAKLDAGVVTTTFPYEKVIEGSAPHQQVSLRAAFDLEPKWKFDVWLRWMEDFSNHDSEHGDPRVADYVELDLRLGWQPHRDLELSLGARNLLHKTHREYSIEPLLLYFRNDVEPDVYARMRYAF